MEAGRPLTVVMIPPDHQGSDAAPTVFIVDDDDAVRDSLAVLLEAAGLPVAAFASGVEFLAAYERGRPGCLLLDLDLPGMSGPEVLRALVAAGAKLPVILITGRRDGVLRAQATAEDVVGLLEKPFQDQVLMRTIGAALGRHAPARRGAAGSGDA